MNINEIKEVIAALAPAGQAVHETAAIYLATKVVEPVLITATILGGLKMIISAIDRNNKRLDAAMIEKELNRWSRHDQACDKTFLEYAEAEQVREAMRVYFRRRFKSTSVMGGSLQIHRATPEAVNELITFLEQGPKK